MFEAAKWIASPDTEQASPLFRREFSVKPGLKSASLSFCGLGYGVATVNGKPITADVLTTPLTKFDATVLYNTYDVTTLLKGEDNAAGIMLGNGWYNDIASVWDYEKAPWRHHPKLIFQLDLCYGDGSTETLVSDSSWKTAEGPCIYNHVRCGDVWDARRELPGWDLPGYEEKNWNQAFVCRSPGGLLKPAELPPIRNIRTVPAKEVFPGVYDIGENISGWARIEVQGNPGDTLDLIYSERLNADGSLDTWEIDQHCHEEFAHRDRYVLKGGKPETWEPRFCYHGFRYVKAEGTARLLSLEARVVHTDLKIIGEFSCGDPMLNRIHEAVRRATLCNYHSVPTDCPHREQNGWTGDALLSSEQALMNYDMTAAYRKWLRDFADVQRPSGQVPGIVPTGSWGFNWGSGPAWDSALILIPYYVWKYRDDLSLAQEFWPNMERYMGYMETMTEHGLVDFGLGDWCPPENAAACPSMLTDTAYCYVDASAMAELAQVLGKPETRYTVQAAQAKKAFRDTFYVDRKVMPESQTSYACAIYQGLLEEDEKIAAAARLNELVLEKDCHIDCGILGTKYIFSALSDYGYGNTLLRMVENPTCPSYAYWINEGMTTLCEDWEMKLSRNHHMFSEVDFWFYRYLAGIRTDGGKLVVAPLFLDGVDWVKASHGEVQVYWNQDMIEVDIPKAGELNLNGKVLPLHPGKNQISRN